MKSIPLTLILALCLLAPSAYALLGCNPGTSECLNDSTYHVCGEHALWGEPITCDMGMSCANGQCQSAIGCKPGTSECTSTTTYHTCNSYALWDPDQSCTSGWTCQSGQCTGPVKQCDSVGQTRCAPDGSNLVQVCSSNYQWETRQTCDYGCSSGSCRQCSPNSARCAGTYYYQSCNGDGTWSGNIYCGSNSICQGGGNCVTDPSIQCNTVGQTRCASSSSSNTLQKCQNNHQWADYQVCPMGCFYNACRQCSSGQTTCRDSYTFLMCTSQGQWGLDTSCPTGYTCFMGSCQKPSGSQCTSIGQKRCSSSDPSMVQICGGNYVYVDYVTCGQGCADGECMACKPGASYCAGSGAYQTCSVNGQYNSAVPCPAGQNCTNGQCVQASVCTDLQRTCTGNSIQVCNGGQWALYINCPSTTDCTESQGTAYCKDKPAPEPAPEPTPAPTPQKDTGIIGGIVGFFKSLFGLI